MLLSLHIQEHTSLCLFPSSPLSNGKETQCRREVSGPSPPFIRQVPWVAPFPGSINQDSKCLIQFTPLVWKTSRKRLASLGGLWAWLHPVLPSLCSLPLEEDRRVREQGSCWEAGGAASVAHLHTPPPALANSSSCPPLR